MTYQSIFTRYELKYLLTQEQKQQVLDAMEPYMTLDAYGRTTIRNIYFDTDNYRLIRRSIEKPVYKEKLRLRSYHEADADTPVFVELKKKYRSVVYKRRISMPQKQAFDWIRDACASHEDSQIAKEIDYFIHFYENLKPSFFLSYDREAYYSHDDSDFRVTFDDNILCRQENFSFQSAIYGTPLLEEGLVLMELKTSCGIPLWMTHTLTTAQIYKTPFSKYGTAYQTIIYPKHKGEHTYA